MVTHDTWHLTFDMWQVINGGRRKFSENLSSLALEFWIDSVLKILNTKDDQLNQWNNESLNDKGVYRTALATLSLLKRMKFKLANTNLESYYAKLHCCRTWKLWHLETQVTPRAVSCLNPFEQQMCQQLLRRLRATEHQQLSLSWFIEMVICRILEYGLY